MNNCSLDHLTFPSLCCTGGGNIDTVRLLIEKGANPNSRGQFLRTPLYRAAFAGHLEVAQALLQYGSDPRLYADDGQMPENVGITLNLSPGGMGWR